MATVNPTVHLSGLARRLVMDGLLDEAEAAKAHETALKKRTHFVSYLVENKILSSSEIAWSGAQEFGVPLFDLNAMLLDVAPVKMVSEKLIQQHHALPLFKRGNRLYIAVSDPTNLGAIDEFKFHTGINTEAVLVEEDQLNKSINEALEALDTTMSELMDADLDNLDVSSGDDDTGDNDVSESDIDDTPVVRFVNKVLLDAINSGTSDIHLEPYEKEFRVRFRQDGVVEFNNVRPLPESVGIILTIDKEFFFSTSEKPGLRQSSGDHGGAGAVHAKHDYILHGCLLVNVTATNVFERA